MGPKVKPVHFKKRNGIKLFGILHTPPQHRGDIGIIILSPGIKNRVAPHRLYVKMARRFCDLGFQVFRFDPEGLGDSEGEIIEKFSADLYGSIQVGRFIEDTICAMNWMEKECKVSRFILSGLCGGAITGLLTGAMDIRVHSLLCLGIPVILDSAGTDQSKYMTRGQLENLRSSYIKKLLDLKSWVRFCSMKSDYRLMLKSILTGIKGKAGNFRSNYHDKVNSTNLDKQVGDNFNPYFPLALHNMLSSRKVLLIFSEADRLFWEFEEKYMRQYKNELEKRKGNITIFIAKHANHIFSFEVWQKEMLNISCEWLNKFYSQTIEEKFV